MGDLTGKVAIVTGGTRGIGRAISERLAERGMRVAAVYASNEEAAKELLDANPEASMSIHQGDVSEPEDCERVCQEVLDEHGRLDVVVNNAGITIDKPAIKMEPDDWDSVIRINLNGAFYMCRAALEHLLESDSGRIINISSVVGEIGNMAQVNYSAAKAGLLGLTYTLAKELAEQGITVNAVTPGFIDTDMVAQIPDDMLEQIIENIPVGRLGKADEVAHVVEFLADPDASYVTGSVFSVNGGIHLGASGL